MRICIDLDGTICDIRHDPLTYADVAPKPGAAEKIRALRQAGHTVVIHTARNMGSTGHNVGKALANVGRVTFEWLARHGIEYDEIFFGKPNSDVIIDDRAVRFVSWDGVTEELLRKEARAK
jgi:capsule biosynthesis phosphatase